MLVVAAGGGTLVISTVSVGASIMVSVTAVVFFWGVASGAVYVGVSVLSIVLEAAWGGAARGGVSSGWGVLAG